MMKQTSQYVEETDSLVVTTTYDPTATLEANKEARLTAPKHRISNGKVLVKVMEIEEGHIIALKELGYNLLSPDQDEVKRALLYVQNNEPYWMTVNGKPIAKFRQRWV